MNDGPGATFAFRLRPIFFKILQRSGYLRMLMRRNRNAGRVPVLAIHKVTPDPDETWPGMHPDLFRELVLKLRELYEIVPPSALLTRKPAELRNACIITFDDGYTDFLHHAYPILRETNTPCGLFVIPYDLSNHGHIWTSTVIHFVNHYSGDAVVDFFRSHGLETERMMVHRKDSFRLNLAIARQLCDMSHVQRNRIIEALMTKLENEGHRVEKELLDFDELRMLDPGIVEINSHSFTHPSFSLEYDEKMITYELGESKTLIERELKVEPFFFAFPFTKFNEPSLRKVREYYRGCFTGINQPVDLNKLAQDPQARFDLHRYYVHHHSVSEILFLINGFHKKLENRPFSRSKDPRAE